jgi:hypothetical protein
VNGFIMLRYIRIAAPLSLKHLDLYLNIDNKTMFGMCPKIKRRIPRFL